jgi:hypothetical protein
MRNQYEQIPDHLQPEWEAVCNEVREASLELQKANERYHKAILARIAMTETVNKAWSEF